MRVTSPAKSWARPGGFHLRLNDPEPSLFPSYGASESISVAQRHTGISVQTAPAPGVSVSMLRWRQKFHGLKKLSSIHNSKFLPLSTLSVVAG